MFNPDAYMSKLINFLCFLRQRCEDFKLENNVIIACDETAIMVRCYFEIDCTRKSCKEVSVFSTGDTRNRLTVLQSVKSDGTILKPYILLPRKRHVLELVKKFGSKVILVLQGTNCMNQAITEDYLNCVVGGPILLHIDCLYGTV